MGLKFVFFGNYREVGRKGKGGGGEDWQRCKGVSAAGLDRAEGTFFGLEWGCSFPASEPVIGLFLLPAVGALLLPAVGPLLPAVGPLICQQ